jgi:catechol-2,3-dioxygenase
LPPVIPLPSDGSPPNAASIDAVITMFYYEDLPSAAAWYEDVMAFKPLMSAEGFALFEVAGNTKLALVGAGYGSQEPIKGRNKGAILSIQTSDLEHWHSSLFARGVEGTGVGLCVGAGGRTIEFKISDPEGYTIEFFEWIA